MKNKKLIFTVCVLFAAATSVFAQFSFDGYTGIRLDPVFYNPKEDKADFLTGTTSFFTGQINFTQNLLARAEGSLYSGNLFGDDIFRGKNTTFWLDELSIVHMAQLTAGANYASVFAGNYEPIGSDIFLQRQFGISPIGSQILNGWLGSRNSSINPTFNFGASNIFHLGSEPMAFGGYISFNKNNGNFFSADATLRYATAYRLFAIDFAAGIGTPIETKDIVTQFDRIYLHGGITMLVGNSYTQSLFVQAGVLDTAIETGKDKKSEFESSSFYIVFEPRFRLGNFQLHLSLFSLPQETIARNMLLRDTFGVNMLVLHDATYIAKKRFTLGMHSTISTPNKNLIAACKGEDILSDGMSFTLAPYASTDLLNGELNVMMQIEPIKINGQGDWTLAVEANRPEKMFRLNVGYKIRL